MPNAFPQAFKPDFTLAQSHMTRVLSHTNIPRQRVHATCPAANFLDK